MVDIGDLLILSNSKALKDGRMSDGLLIVESSILNGGGPLRVGELGQG